MEEGQQIARVGKSGTVYAHNHFTIFKVDPATLPQGIDTVATTWQQLNDWWEDPIAFIEKWMHHDNEGGEVGMADYYPSTKPQLDLSNRDSMKVAVDVWRKLVTGELVDKKELNKALEELENTRKEVSNLNGTLTEKNEKIEELYLELSSHGSELLRLANENKRLTTQANLVPELNDKIEELEKFRKTTLENQETYNRQLAYYKGRSLDEASISALLTRLIQKIMEAISKGGEKK